MNTLMPYTFKMQHLAVNGTTHSYGETANGFHQKTPEKKSLPRNCKKTLCLNLGCTQAGMQENTRFSFGKVASLFFRRKIVISE